MLYLMLTFDKAGQPVSRMDDDPIALISQAMIDRGTGRIQEWQLALMDFSWEKTPDGAIEGLAMPVCQSPNWHKFLSDDQK